MVHNILPNISIARSVRVVINADFAHGMTKLLKENERKKYSDKKPEDQINKIKQTDSEYLQKLDSLLDQNKTIAKGIMLMEERIRQRSAPQPPKEESEFGGMIKSRPLPKY